MVTFGFPAASARAGAGQVGNPALDIKEIDILEAVPAPIGQDLDIEQPLYAIVRVIMARCRLLGLDGPSLLRGEDSRPRTLVVPALT